VAFLGEPFDTRMATAAALVFAGVAFVRWAPVRTAAATEPVPTDQKIA
jgi:drug/metabolite transporter (DMT)-like permease